MSWRPIEQPARPRGPRTLRRRPPHQPVHRPEAGLKQAQLMEEQTTHQALPIVWGAAIGIEAARIKVRVENVGLGTALNLCLWVVSPAGVNSDTVVLPAPLKGGSDLPGPVSVNPPPGVPPDLSGLTINAHYKDISNREYMTVTRQGNIEVFEAATADGNTTPRAQIISLYEPHHPR